MGQLTDDGPARTAAFRFAFCYLGLFCLQLLPVVNLPVLGLYEAGRPLDRWVAARVLRWERELDYGPTGSGDTSVNYVRTVTRLGLAAGLTAGWTLIGRRPRSAWPPAVLQMLLRYALGSVMLSYGVGKLIPPGQFGELEAFHLQQTYGESSPMGLLWKFMAASFPYAAFGGLVEAFGGLLLLFRRTALLGALLVAGVMTNVFLLNLCYDVPVKLNSGHYLLMAAALIVPHAGRLWDLLVLNRPVPAADLRLPARPAWARSWLGVVKWVYVGLVLLWVVGVNLSMSLARGSSAPPTRGLPLSGIYDVDWVERAGKVLPPRRTDPTRWRWLTVEADGRSATVTAEDSSVVKLELAAGPGDRLTVTPTKPPGPPAEWAVERPAPGVVEVSGSLNGEPLRLGLYQPRREDFPLTKRGFHWVSERPYNR